MFVNRPIARISLFLVVAILAVFWQGRDHDFVNFDDDLYVTANPHVQAGLTVDGVVWAFTTTHASNWHPLTWLSHMVDCHLFGLNPGGHHFGNLLLHIANTLLLFLVLKQMTGALWPSGFVAALFAIHPLHIESVAWVAERKDVLSTFFWLLTMGVYLRYVKRPGMGRYLLIFLSFSLGLMAKPMLVTLPFVLLLLDYWPLGRFEFAPLSLTTQPHIAKSEGSWSRRFLIRRLILEKVPLFGLATVSSIVTFLAQQSGGAVESLSTIPVHIRIANALVAYVSYIEKTIWPHDLAVFYPHPHPGHSLPVWQVAGAGLLLLSITVLVLRTVRRHPYLTTGWLWYLGTLVPVIGLVQVGAHAMADRYTYVPLIGLFIIMAWGLDDILTTWPHQRTAIASASGLLLLSFMICSSFQIRHWKNSITLFQHTLNVTTNNWLAHSNMGNALARQGKFDRAIFHNSKALEIKPNYPRAHNNLGIALAQQGKTDEAIAHYAMALEIEPNYPRAHNNLGIALAQQGKTDEAIAHYAMALRVKPDLAAAHYNMGNALAQQRKLENAIAHYMEALDTRPDFAEVHNNLGMVLAQQGKIDDAIGHFSQALHIKPYFPEAKNNLEIAVAERRESL